MYNSLFGVDALLITIGTTHKISSDPCDSEKLESILELNAKAISLRRIAWDGVCFSANSSSLKIIFSLPTFSNDEPSFSVILQHRKRKNVYKKQFVLYENI